MEFVGEHDVDVFIILPPEHRESPIDFSWKKRHPLVLDRWAIERDEFEMKEVRGFNELRQDHFAVVRGIGRIVISTAVVLLKHHETSVFDAVALRRRCGKQNRSEERRVGKECRSRWSP